VSHKEETKEGYQSNLGLLLVAYCLAQDASPQEYVFRLQEAGLLLGESQETLPGDTSKTG